MRYSSAARNLSDGETAAQLREKFLRVTTPCTTLKAERAEPVADFETLIARLAHEIDETVLPRCFALFSDAGMEATLVVSNRRLIELEIGEKKVTFDGETDTDADSVARICAKALRALSLRAGALRLRPVGRAPKVTTKGSTCTARHLAEYARPATLENRLKAFLKLSHPKTLGWVYRAGDGQIVTHDPDPAVLEKLQQLQAAISTPGETSERPRRVERAGPNCSAFALSRDAQVMIVEDGHDRLVAAIPASDLTATMAIWHQVFGRATS